jgi:tetratricopeptide (TPR) repeat protein
VTSPAPCIEPGEGVSSASSAQLATETEQAGRRGKLKLRQQGVDSSREDLLKQIEGVDGRILKGLRLRQVGRVATLLSTAGGATALLIRNGWPPDVHGMLQTAPREQWFLVALAAAVASSAILSHARQWIRDARQPFRYTYSVDPFEPISGSYQSGTLAWARDWIRADLILMLSVRIGRLTLLPQEKVTSDTPAHPASHIHIGGSFGSRRTKKKDHTKGGYRNGGDETIELMPRVRIGSDACASAVAHDIRWEEPKLPDLKKDRLKYDHILERVYFNVSTEIYKQIRLDIERKIARLPTVYLRATAYFNEAEDYARSNTLDSFNDARELYAKALDLYDRTRISLPKWPVLRRLRTWILRSIIPSWRWVARVLAIVFPRFGRRDLQIARAETGYAKVVLFRNILANLSGREAKRIFEARRYARDALQRLNSLPDGVPERNDACFEAHLIAALAEYWAGDIEAAHKELERARSLRPADAEDHALFPFVAGSLEPRLHPKIRLLQRAVELNRRFEIAHFELAFNQEQLWRSRDDLDEIGASVVKRRYEAVTTLFPANLTAWANLGYVRWLLWDRRDEEAATDVLGAFEGGLRYKAIREESFVAELDYGLARVFAELGMLNKAYDHYVHASQAGMAQAVEGGTVDYWFDRINEAILDRFRRYKRNVERQINRQGSNGHPTEWLHDAVLAFVYTDWGNACAAYYRRSGDTKCREEAFRAFAKAIELNPRYVLARRSRTVLRLWTKTGLDRANRDLVEVRRSEPRWLPAQLDLVKTKIALAEREGRPQHLVQAAREAAKDVLAALPESSAKPSLTGREVDPARMIKRVRSRRRRAELLEVVTGPIADGLAAWAEACALEAGKKTGQAAARVCLYVHADLLPANRILLKLVRDLAKTAGMFAVEAPGMFAPKLYRLDRLIVQSKLESDPAHAYWLGELVELEGMDAETVYDALRMAARWPGASPAVLEWIAMKLEKCDPATSNEAKKRAAFRRIELENRAAEERLEDGYFEDRRLAARMRPRVESFLSDPATHEAVLLRDIRGAAFPSAYVLLRDHAPEKAKAILYAVAEKGADDRCAVASFEALAHFAPPEELKEHLPKIVAKHPSSGDFLKDLFERTQRFI